MRTYSLDNRNGETLTETLYRAIRADIGTLPAGERMPSKRALAQHLKISVITVENAYAQLVAEGYLRAEARRGFFVEQTAAGVGGAVCRTAVDADEPSPPEWRLDLKTNRVDPARFPFATWSRLMRQVLSEQDKKLLQPTPHQGVPVLRQAIADYLRSFRGMEVTPGQIVVGAGTEYLYQLLLQLLGTAQPFAVEDPGYPKLAKIYGKGGAVCCPVPLDEQGISLSALLESGAGVAHISPSHHYPTGAVTSMGRRQELLRWAGQERTIIEDDYDSEFRFAGRPIRPLQSMDEHGRVIYMNTFSQTIAPSMRISYMVLPPALLAQYRRELDFYACTVPSFEQYALAKFIGEGYFEKHLARMRTYYRRQRERVLAAFRGSPFAGRITLTEKGAGLHFLLRLDTRQSDEALRHSAAARGVRLSFLSEYAALPNPDFDHTLVVNYSGAGWDCPEDAIALLAEIFA
ncbi:MAG: PLP-dependent aminotransferase family protein, partial [Oscillospiraceae bacterium]